MCQAVYKLNSCSIIMKTLQFHIIFGLIVLLYKPGCAFEEIKNKSQAVEYLSAFGYLETALQYNPKLAHKLTNKVYRNALIEFQIFLDIPPTGILDKETLKALNIQRCGCIDRFYRVKQDRFKRYVRLPDGWRLTNLNYKISRYPTRELNQIQTDTEIKRAFDQWSAVTPLKFNQVENGPVHINIAFRAHDHGDINPFDGKLGVFAHTLTPSRDNVHFDDSETWTTGTKRGTNLYQVALHEFGHMLGLDHTRVKFAVMRPVYPGYHPSAKLKNDDIEGIQELYGENNVMDSYEKQISKRHTSNQNNSVDNFNNRHCKVFNIDTIFISNSGEIYMFKDDSFWKWTRIGLAEPYPKLISDKWIGLPNNIDAAFIHKNGQTYFFKGSKYWRFTDTSIDKGFPREITFDFIGIPNNIDSAMSFNNTIYFFKGEKYWIYDPTKRPSVSNEYPRPLSDWKSVPASIDAVFSSNDNIITFVKNDLYYIFDATTSSVQTQDLSLYLKDLKCKFN